MPTQRSNFRKDSASAFISVERAINDVVLKNQEISLTSINNLVVSGQQISLTAKQQAIAIRQVVEAINTLNASIKETAQGLGQTKIGTQQLNSAAKDLKAML